MVEVMAPLLLVVIGIWCLGWAVRTGAGVLGTRRAVGDVSAAGEHDADRVEVTGTAQPTALGQSPLRGVACVHWNVRVARIIERVPGGSGSRLETVVDVDASSSAPFEVMTDGGPITVDTTWSRIGSGHEVVHRDQASVERSIELDGRSYPLPPTAYGSRQVSEAAVAPGQVVWLWGDARQGPAGMTIAGTEAAPLRIDLTPQAARRQQALGIAAGVGVVGLLALLGGVTLLT